MSEQAGENGLPPFTGDNPCPDCRPGICHRCGEAKRDAWIAPHMGVILCSACFYSKFGGES